MLLPKYKQENGNKKLFGSIFENIYIAAMTTKDISPHQYAKWWGHHVSYVHRLLLNQELDKMPFVESVKKYSRFYTLQVPETLTADSFKTILPEKISK